MEKRVADLGEQCFAVGRNVLDVALKQNDAAGKVPVVGAGRLTDINAEKIELQPFRDELRRRGVLDSDLNIFQKLAKLRWQSEERLFDGVVERSPFEPERPEVVLGIELRSARESAVRFVDAPQQSKSQSSDFVGIDVIFVERGSLVGEAKGLLRLSLLEAPETELDKILGVLRANASR